MDETNDALGTPGRLPGEVVEYYQPRERREVVETYVQPHPLPGRIRRPAPPKKKSRKGLWIFLICMLTIGALAAGAYFWLAAQERKWQDYYPAGSEEPQEGITIPVTDAAPGMTLAVTRDHGRELTPQEIYQQVNPSVVTVLVELEKNGSVGTGVLFTEDGYLLTNYHVVDGGRQCRVVLADDTTYSASYVAGDEINDLAILKVDGQNLLAAELGSSDDLTVGDPVYAIGNPLGVELRGTFTDGIVSAISRDVTVEGRTMTLVQTNAALNSGNSGGPLINRYGQVVGINTVKMSSAFSNIEGLGFAIPTSIMQYIVNDLLAYGVVIPEPILGITVEIVPTALPDGSVGARIHSVDEGGAGQRAGLLPDDVIVEADGEAVSTSADVLRIRRRFNVGDQMTMRIWRSGAYLDLLLELDES